MRIKNKYSRENRYSRKNRYSRRHKISRRRPRRKKMRTKPIRTKKGGVKLDDFRETTYFNSSRDEKGFHRKKLLDKKLFRLKPPKSYLIKWAENPENEDISIKIFDNDNETLHAREINLETLTLKKFDEYINKLNHESYTYAIKKIANKQLPLSKMPKYIWNYFYSNNSCYVKIRFSKKSNKKFITNIDDDIDVYIGMNEDKNMYTRDSSLLNTSNNAYEYKILFNLGFFENIFTNWKETLQYNC